jgi:hypothetical protein
MFDRLDPSARDVMLAAYTYALHFGDRAISTEHVLLALASSTGAAADLLADAGCDTDRLRYALAAQLGHPPERDHAALLTALGVDLHAVRDHARHTFGTGAVNRAAIRTAPSRTRRSLWSRISCNTAQRPQRCDSLLAGELLGMIPRVKRLLDRATRDVRPGLATPIHLLHELVRGREPASEVLAALGVDLDGLGLATASAAGLDDKRGRRAS